MRGEEMNHEKGRPARTVEVIMNDGSWEKATVLQDDREGNLKVEQRGLTWWASPREYRGVADD